MDARSSAMTDREVVVSLLENELEALTFDRSTRLGGACAQLLSSRGGQLRGRVLLAAARQGPRPDRPEVRRAALAIELLHLASLAHDDVIDTGISRRGAPTANAEFGQRTAGFAGGWLVARTEELIAECGLPALDALSDTAIEMTRGGMRELCELYEVQRSTDAYFAAAESKTGVTIALAGRIGAQLAHASDAVVAQSELFGRELGIAYQIWDDLADLDSRTEEGEQAALLDLLQGVYTLPVIYALEESAELREMLAGGRTSEADRVTALTLIKSTGGVERASKDADVHVGRATVALRGLRDPDSLGELLAEARLLQLGPPQ